MCSACGEPLKAYVGGTCGKQISWVEPASRQKKRCAAMWLNIQLSLESHLWVGKIELSWNCDFVRTSEWKFSLGRCVIVLTLCEALLNTLQNLIYPHYNPLWWEFLLSAFFRWRTRGIERLSYIPKMTQPVSGKTGKTQAVCLQSTCPLSWHLILSACEFRIPWAGKEMLGDRRCLLPDYICTKIDPLFC